MNAAILGQTLVSALQMSAVYALFALGLTLVFGLLDIVNFAHGQLLLGGAYLTFTFSYTPLGFWGAMICAVLCVALGGAILDVALFARVRKQPISGLLISVGLISVLEGIYRDVWGVQQLNIEPPFSGVWQIGDVVVSFNVMLVIVGAAIILLIQTFFLKSTRLGRALRATGQNAEAAQLMGIPVEAIRTLTFAIGAALAAFSGALLSTVLPVEPALGADPLIYGFIVLILGGAGSPLGAVLGAIIIAFVQAFATQLWSAGAASIIALGILIVVMYVRPEGLIRVQRRSTL